MAGTENDAALAQLLAFQLMQEHGGGFSSQRLEEQRELEARYITRSQINALPTHPFDGDAPSSGASSASGEHSYLHECAICWETYTRGVMLKHLPCMHVFHAGCVDEWLTEHTPECPLCKQPIAIAFDDRALGVVLAEGGGRSGSGGGDDHKRRPKRKDKKKKKKTKKKNKTKEAKEKSKAGKAKRQQAEKVGRRQAEADGRTSGSKGVSRKVVAVRRGGERLKRSERRRGRTAGRSSSGSGSDSLRPARRRLQHDDNDDLFGSSSTVSISFEETMSDSPSGRDDVAIPPEVDSYYIDDGRDTDDDYATRKPGGGCCC